MPQITFITNNNKKIEVPEDTNLLRASLRYDGGIPFRCGAGICGTCLCKIEEGREHLDKVKKLEYRHLTEEMIEQGYRMACQTFISGDVAVSWDPERAKRRRAKKVTVK